MHVWNCYTIVTINAEGKGLTLNSSPNDETSLTESVQYFDESWSFWLKGVENRPYSVNPEILDHGYHSVSDLSIVCP